MWSSTVNIFLNYEITCSFIGGIEKKEKKKYIYVSLFVPKKMSTDL